MTRHRFLSWLLAALLLCSAALRGAAPALIAGGAKTTWQYFDGPGDPGAAWASPDFPAANWQRGPAPLGYGEPKLGTTLGFGGKPEARPLAAYFRHEFEVKDPSGLPPLALSLRVDDGAALYLNGKEFLRVNLPAGPLTATTIALERIDGQAETIYRQHALPAGLLVPGRNVLAVEVHQFNAVSSDLVLDLSLKPFAPGEVPKAIVIPEAARAISLAYLKNHYVPAGTRIPDGYHDGGRGMRVTREGAASSGREILVVDRARDPDLRRHLDHARAPMFASLPPVERAQLLALYIDKLYSPPEGRGKSEAVCALELEPHRGRDIILGKIIRAGVCRHRSLLFKLMADEAGLSVALARGIYGPPGDSGNHAWNELLLPTGEKLIVDVMNPRPGFAFPKLTDRLAAQYTTVDKQPYYPRQK